MNNMIDELLQTRQFVDELHDERQKCFIHQGVYYPPLNIREIFKKKKKKKLEWTQ
jgi:hypothetical protein